MFGGFLHRITEDKLILFLILIQVTTDDPEDMRNQSSFVIAVDTWKEKN